MKEYKISKVKMSTGNTISKSVSFNKICSQSDGSVCGLKSDDNNAPSQEFLLKLGMEFSDRKLMDKQSLHQKVSHNKGVVRKQPRPTVKTKSVDVAKVKCRWPGCKVVFSKNGKAMENHINAIHRKKEGLVDQSQFLPGASSTPALFESQPLVDEINDLEETAMETGEEEVTSANARKRKLEQVEEEERRRRSFSESSAASSGISVAVSDSLTENPDQTLMNELGAKIEEGKVEAEKSKRNMGDMESELTELRQKLYAAEEQIDEERREAKDINDGLREELREAREKVKVKENDLAKAQVAEMRMLATVPDNELGALVKDLRDKLSAEYAKHSQARSDKDTLENKVKEFEATLQTMMKSSRDKSDLIDTLKRDILQKDAQILEVSAKVPCHHFWDRGCGDVECKFSHSLKYGEGGDENLAVNPCKYTFLDGNCKWAQQPENCKFDHVMPEDPARRSRFKEVLERIRKADERNMRHRKRSRSRSPGRQGQNVRTPNNWRGPVNQNWGSGGSGDRRWTPEGAGRGHNGFGSGGFGNGGGSGGRRPGDNQNWNQNQGRGGGSTPTGHPPVNRMSGITQFNNEEESKRRRTNQAGDFAVGGQEQAQASGNDKGCGDRVIPPLPVQRGHQSANAQVKMMQRVAQSPGFQKAEDRWTGDYYRDFPPFPDQAGGQNGQFYQNMSHPPPPIQGQNQYQQRENLDYRAQYPLREQGEEFNLYKNMERNNRRWGRGRGGSWY